MHDSLVTVQRPKVARTQNWFSIMNSEAFDRSMLQRYQSKVRLQTRNDVQQTSHTKINPAVQIALDRVNSVLTVTNDVPPLTPGEVTEFPATGFEEFDRHAVPKMIQRTKDDGNLDHVVPVQSLLLPPSRPRSLSEENNSPTESVAGEMIDIILSLYDDRDTRKILEV